jgi:putative nucleotidyltransferase with HDIG domain
MNLKKISIDEITQNLTELSKNSIPIWRKNRDGKFVTIPHDKINQYLNNEKYKNLSFLIEENWISRIKTDFELKASGTIESVPAQALVYDNFTEKIIDYKKIPFEKRIELYGKNIKELEETAKISSMHDISSVGTIAKATADAFCINKATFEENMDEYIELPEVHLKNIAKETTRFVDSIVKVLKQNSISANYIDLLNDLSTGSTIDHVNNVLLRFVPFCNYINSSFQKGRISRIRVNFEMKYLRHYKKLKPDTDDVKLENIFKGGLREINPEEIKLYSLATLMHDIGKIGNLNYFEGDDGYDKKKIMKHAILGYNMILKAREFSKEVAVIAALHHEYYDHSSGYGMMKALFPKKNYLFNSPQYCVSYSIDDLKNGQSMSYFPAKVLEIVDVFDALTDTKRQYRAKRNTTSEALKIMKESFIENDLKIDPILFSIFTDFIREHSIN